VPKVLPDGDHHQMRRMLKKGTIVRLRQSSAPGLSLWPYQTCGVATALVERRVVIGDEMGLGKTVQALIATEAADTYPSVIVCPASLRANWVAEVHKFLPHREVLIATGKPVGRSVEVTVISYSLLHQWLDQFQNPGTVILDEGHYCSNPSRLRSRSALALTSRVHDGGLIMSLTGTPFVNKPVELAAQLRLIRLLRTVTPTPEAANDERAWTKNFEHEWCQDIASLRQLHRRISQVCYIRRQRKDVLGRNDTVRKEVWLTLELDEYREAEADLVRYLTERDGTKAAARVSSVEGLAKLTHLRRLVGESKIWAARRWIDNFFVSNPERSLVVYAYHKAVQTALVDHYKCARILGGEVDVEDQKARFQSGESRLIICSSSAAREGHTLTRASDVAIIEPRWVPMDQEEGRINRIGQTAESTYAWYLLGAGTIDECVWKIIEAKRKLFRAGAEGKGTAEMEQGVTTELLNSYRRDTPTRQRGPDVPIGHEPRLATIIPIGKGA
jgi:SWI/SNF-related matrix-associated actin-dependent regulator 1 of chromatin subfamily A